MAAAQSILCQVATSGGWQTTVGTVASTAGLTGLAFSAITGVQTAVSFVSPNGSFTKSERKLKMVKSLLEELSPQRREEIESAARSGSSEFATLEHLEKQMTDLLDMHHRLSNRCDELGFKERYDPRSVFRKRLKRFEEEAKALLHDTLKTTVPCLDDIEFDPETSRRATQRPPSLESTESFKTARDSFPDDGDIPLSPGHMV